jgi:hypothetical protein
MLIFDIWLEFHWVTQAFAAATAWPTTTQMMQGRLSAAHIHSESGQRNTRISVMTAFKLLGGSER